MTRPTFTPHFEEQESAIRDRVLARVPDTWRKEPGDYPYDMVAATPLEVKQLQINQDYVLKNSFAQYAEDAWLDQKLDEVGLTRGQATENKRTLSILADAGVVIPAGYKATVVVLDAGGNPVEYTVDFTTTYAASGSKNVPITCKQTGTLGNIADGSQFILLPPIPGVRAITDTGTTLPGTDKETDETAYDRYAFKVRNPDTGGNKNNYVVWTGEVEGVGKSTCVPRWNGNGTVKVVVIGTDYKPATQDVADDVQAYLDPLLNVIVQAEVFGLTGNATIDSPAVKLSYDTEGADAVAFFNDDMALVLETENTFKALVKVKVSDVVGTADLLQITIQDRDTQVAFKQAYGSSTDAQVVLSASDLGTDYTIVAVPFYWDGLQHVEVELRRLNTELVTDVRVDYVNLKSLYGQGLGNGKAPAGARVFAKPAEDLPVAISVAVTYTVGFVEADVEAAFSAAVTGYLASVAFTETPVVYAKIGALLISTDGVSNYANLTINGGTADITPASEEVATLGAVSM